jgi:hypothetical protein
MVAGSQIADRLFDLSALSKTKIRNPLGEELWADVVHG